MARNSTGTLHRCSRTIQNEKEQIAFRAKNPHSPIGAFWPLATPGEFQALKRYRMSSYHRVLNLMKLKPQED